MKTTEYIQNGILIRKIDDEPSDYTSTEEKAERLAICESCDYYQDQSCVDCGCILETLLLYKAKHCPLNKW